MYTYKQALDKIIQNLAIEKLIFPLCEICCIPQGVSKKTIKKLVTLGYLICESSPNTDGSIPIIVFVYNQKEDTEKIIQSVNQLLYCKYPNFYISDTFTKKKQNK